MRFRFFSLLLFAAFAVFLACSDDDGKPSSSFTINNKTYALSDAEYYMEESDVVYYAITLSSMSTKEYREVRFTLSSSTDEGLPAGTYSFDAENLYGVYANVLDIVSGDQPVDFESPDSGQVVVEKSGDTYTFNFEFDFDGTITTGSFKGKLELSDI